MASAEPSVRPGQNASPAVFAQSLECRGNPSHVLTRLQNTVPPNVKGWRQLLGTHRHGRPQRVLRKTLRPPSLSPSYSMLEGEGGEVGRVSWEEGAGEKKPMNLSRYYDGNDTRVAKMSRWSFCLGTNYSRLRVLFSLSLHSLVCAIGCMLG